jgi:acyl-CoA synthetase (AMP-forming)/AMP-acid ligase II
MITTPDSKRALYRQQGFFSEQRLHDLLYATALAKPGEIALVDPLNRPELCGQVAQRMNYQQLQQRIELCAAGLVAHRIRKDDIILAQLPNIVELLILYMACSRIGAIISPVPMQYQQHELNDIFTVLKPKAVAYIEHFKQQSGGSAIAAVIEAQYCENCKILSIVVGENTGPHYTLFSELESAGSPDTLEHYLNSTDINADDILTICWTSGTEGLPKGISRSHNQWLTIGRATYEGNQLQDGESLLNPFPFINMASIGGLMMSWLYSRGKLVLHHPIDLAVFVRQLTEENISYTLAPPPLLNNIIKHPEMLPPDTLKNVHTIGSGSAPLDSWMVSGFKQQYNIEVINHFGSNEGVSLVCGPKETNDPEQRARLFPIQNKRLNTRLCDPESGELVTQMGQTGELQIQGPGVFDGYFKAPEKTAAAFTKDGYYKTGDLFEVANDEFYRFVGRCKDLIIRGGVNIAPAELDNLINAHPGIEEAAVASYPCDEMGERVAVFVVLKESQTINLSDLNIYLKQQKIAHYKLPEKLHLIKAIPRNPLGKALRHKLSQMI